MRHTISLSLLLWLACGPLLSIEQLPPPLRYEDMVQDTHTFLMLDRDYASTEPNSGGQWRACWNGDIWRTRLQAVDSIAIAALTMQGDDGMRHAGFSLRTPHVSAQLTSRSWAQRPGLAGIDAGFGWQWQNRQWRTSGNARQWQGLHHTQGEARLERRMGAVAAAVQAQAAQQPYTRWLAGASLIGRWHGWLLEAGAAIDDANHMFPQARVQLNAGSHLLARLSWLPSLSVAPLDSLFTTGMLAWHMVPLQGDVLRALPVQTGQARLQWAAGHWRGEVNYAAIVADTIRTWHWQGDRLAWGLRPEREWRQTVGGSLRWRGARVAVVRQLTTLHELDARWSWQALVRQRVLPYTSITASGTGVWEQLLQGSQRSYWTSGLGVEYSGPFRISLGARATMLWRWPLPGEADNRLGIGAYFTYRQADHASSR